VGAGSVTRWLSDTAIAGGIAAERGRAVTVPPNARRSPRSEPASPNSRPGLRTRAGCAPGSRHAMPPDETRVWALGHAVGDKALKRGRMSGTPAW